MTISNENEFISLCKEYGEKLVSIIEYLKEDIKNQIVNPNLSGAETQILKHKFHFMGEVTTQIENAKTNTANNKNEYKETF